MRSAGLAAVAIPVGWAGLYLVPHRGVTEALWLAAGVGVCGLVLLGRRVWPGVWVSSFVLNGMLLSEAGSLPRAAAASALVAAIHSGFTVLAAAYISRSGGLSGAFLRVARVLPLIGAMAVIALLSAAATTAVVSGLGLAPETAMSRELMTRWLGKVLGVLLLLPLGAAIELRRPPHWDAKGLEAVALPLTAALISYLVFWGRMPFEALDFPYVAMPVMIWAAVRADSIGVSLCVFTVVTIAAWSGVAGHAVFPYHKPGQGVFALQTYALVMLTTGLTLSAAILEHKQATDELERLNAGLEARVKERTAALEQSVVDLEMFSYTVLHDLRAPLRAMEGYSKHVLEREKTLDPGSRSALQRVADAASRMDRLTRDVLAYSRISRGELELRKVELEAVVDHVVASYPKLAQAELVVRRPIPAVIGQASLLTQAISNLLVNAATFVAPGTRARVEVWAEKKDGKVRLLVRDNGVGIAAEHRERIFRPFERVPGIARSEGTGIGLAVARKALERMRGRVGVESELGEGATFWIELEAAA